MSQQPSLPSGNPAVPSRHSAAAHNHNHTHAHIHGHGSPLVRTSHLSGHSHVHAELDSASLSSSRFDIDWEAKERELEEARARAAQMEKTMRWWSDCTANWREKWSKVRTERNKAREESKLLRTKLEVALKDCSVIRREKQSLESENEYLRREIERLQEDCPKPSIYTHLTSEELADETLVDLREKVVDEAASKPNSPVKNEPPQSPVSALSPRARLSASVSVKEPSSTDAIFGAKPKHHSSASKEYDVEEREEERSARRSASQDLGCLRENRIRDRHAVTSDPIKFLESLDNPDIEFLQQKLLHLQLRLEEATKTIQAERDEKANLNRTTESLQLELLNLRSRVEELRQSRQDIERQFLVSQETHRQQLLALQQDCKDEANNRETLDRRIADLRSELERLQAENAAEWGRRERVETERQALERENKKLRTALSDLQERLERRSSSRGGAGGMSPCAGAGGSENDIKQLQFDLEEKNKVCQFMQELTELKHAHAKLKKALQDKSVELSHSLRRAEHSETEVRRLRARIEELKREVATAEDELDTATNNARKLQRTNEELQEQVESLQMQLTHLQSRLRSSNGSSFLSHRESLLQDTLSEDDANEY